MLHQFLSSGTNGASSEIKNNPSASSGQVNKISNLSSLDFFSFRRIIPAIMSMSADQLEAKTFFQDPHGGSVTRTTYAGDSSGTVSELLVGPSFLRLVRRIDEQGVAFHVNELKRGVNTLVFHRGISSEEELRANEVLIDHTGDPCLEDLGLPTTCAQDTTFLNDAEMQTDVSRLEAVRERLAVFLA